MDCSRWCRRLPRRAPLLRIVAVSGIQLPRAGQRRCAVTRRRLGLGWRRSRRSRGLRLDEGGGARALRPFARVRAATARRPPSVPGFEAKTQRKFMCCHLVSLDKAAPGVLSPATAAKEGLSRTLHLVDRHNELSCACSTCSAKQLSRRVATPYFSITRRVLSVYSQVTLPAIVRNLKCGLKGVSSRGAHAWRRLSSWFQSARLPSFYWRRALPAAHAQAAPAIRSGGHRVRIEDFLTQCTGCHGVNGDQVRWRESRQRPIPAAFFRTTICARLSPTASPARAMRPFNFDASELAGIVAYIRNMRTFDASKTNLGDACPGEALFKGAGNCGSCHRVNGKGPRVAPDLSDIGALRTADLLERSLVDPSGAMLPLNRSVRALTEEWQSHYRSPTQRRHLQRAAHRRPGAPGLSRQSRPSRVHRAHHVPRCRPTKTNSRAANGRRGGLPAYLERREMMPHTTHFAVSCSLALVATSLHAQVSVRPPAPRLRTSRRTG